MLIFRPNQGSSSGQYVNITLNIPVTTTTQASSDLEVITYGQAVNKANLYYNKANETFTTPIELLDPIDNNDASTRKFLFDTIFPVTQADITPTLNQYANLSGDVFTGPVSQVPDPYNLNNTPTDNNTAITTKYALDKLNQAVSAVTGSNAVKTGQIYEMFTQTTPSGYLKCNGADVSKSTYANLYNAIGDQFTPSFVETGGRPWESQYGFNPSLQNDITNWSQEASLVSNNSCSASLVAGNYIYILGGFNGSTATSNIQRASFNSSGNLTSAWTNAGNLPIALYGMGYVATKDRIYLIGGYNGANCVATVYSAPIDATGNIGSFITNTSLPIGLNYSSVFVIKDKLYVVGGSTTPEDTNSVNTVYKATIDNSGNISSWTTLPNFPIACHSGKPLLIKDRIYIFAAATAAVAQSSIYYATFDSNGDIGTWTYTADMPKRAASPVVICNDNYVYAISCSTGYSSPSKSSYIAPILTNGAIGSWSPISLGPVVNYYAQSAIIGNRLYFIGGFTADTGPSSTINSVYSATFNSGVTNYSIYYSSNQNTNTTTFKLPSLPMTQNSAYYIKT